MQLCMYIYVLDVIVSPDIHIPLTPACHFSMLFNFTHTIEPYTDGSIKASSWHREH